MITTIMMAATGRGAIASIKRRDGEISEIAIFNANASIATVTITGRYINDAFADAVKVVDIEPGQTLVLTTVQLGLITNEAAGIEISSTLPVSMMSAETQLGEANASGASIQAAQAWFFGDAFINSLLAGDQYFETLSFYNPTDSQITVEIVLLFSNAEQVTITIDVDARDFAQLDLHKADEILSRPDPLNFFSIMTSAAVPFVSQLTHYDLFLRGGWGNTGGNLGLLNSIATIIDA